MRGVPELDNTAVRTIRYTVDLNVLRAYVVGNRGVAREELLKRVKASLLDVGAVVGPLTVLYLRELDGDVILRRAEAAVRTRGGDGAWLVLTVKRYKARFATLGGEEDYGDVVLF